MAAPFTTVDLSTFNEDARSFSQELGKNLIDWGFCGIKEHNIDQTLIQDVIEMFEEFFSYPDDIKIKYRIHSKNCSKASCCPLLPGPRDLPRILLVHSSVHRTRARILFWTSPKATAIPFGRSPGPPRPAWRTWMSRPAALQK